MSVLHPGFYSVAPFMELMVHEPAERDYHLFFGHHCISFLVAPFTSDDVVTPLCIPPLCPISLRGALHGFPPALYHDQF